MTIALSLPTTVLSLDEEETLARLTTTLLYQKSMLGLPNAYYLGEQLVRNLGIAVPPQLATLRSILGWPGLVVDALEERLDVEGFRLSGETGADQDLWDIWQANDLDEEAPLAHLDALIYGRGYAAVGSPIVPGDAPLVTVESALNTAVLWDPQRRLARAALMYTDAYREAGAIELNTANGATATSALLFLPDQTIGLIRDPGGNWAVADRDVHRLGQVPVVRLANRQRAADRTGRSEITPAVMSITDAACRTLLGLEVAREFYAAPQRWILGASESAFQDSAGNPKSPWETYLGRMLALERDGDGNLPTVGTFATGDPSNYTGIIDMYAKIMSSLSGLPPHYLGYSTQNPASADAIRSSEARLVKRVERKQQAFSGGWEKVMRLALLIRDGSVDPLAVRLETLWADASTPTLAATTDAMQKQVAAGIVPARSDVVLRRLGYTPAEIAQLDADGKREDASGILAAFGQIAGGRVLGTQETAAAAAGGVPISPRTDTGTAPTPAPPAAMPPKPMPPMPPAR